MCWRVLARQRRGFEAFSGHGPFPAVTWWELILRAAIIYFFLLILLRVSGKRQVGQLSPFDLVLLLVLSNAVQNAINGGDNSVLGGVISAIALVSLNYLVGLTLPEQESGGTG